MLTRYTCTACGESIHPDTAAKTQCLCMPCKGGYRARIERGRHLRERERLHEQSPGRQYWRSLLRRIRTTPQGFDGLRPEEKTYYAVRSFIEEVHLGGFVHYFAYSATGLYAHTVDGLLELDAVQSLGLLVQARELLFGEQAFPVQQAVRRRQLHELETRGPPLAAVRARLDALEAMLAADAEQLDARCADYARSHGLYGPPPSAPAASSPASGPPPSLPDPQT